MWQSNGHPTGGGGCSIPTTPVHLPCPYPHSFQVIDGPQSVVFDQAENRLHAHKALLVWLLDAHPKVVP